MIGLSAKISVGVGARVTVAACGAGGSRVFKGVNARAPRTAHMGGWVSQKNRKDLQGPGSGTSTLAPAHLPNTLRRSSCLAGLKMYVPRQPEIAPSQRQDPRKHKQLVERRLVGLELRRPKS